MHISLRRPDGTNITLRGGTDHAGSRDEMVMAESLGMNVAKRRGMRKAIVALARGLAVIMHRMISDGTEFCWNRNDLPTAS